MDNFLAKVFKFLQNEPPRNPNSHRNGNSSRNSNSATPSNSHNSRTSRNSVSQQPRRPRILPSRLLSMNFNALMQKLWLGIDLIFYCIQFNILQASVQQFEKKNATILSDVLTSNIPNETKR